MCDLKEAMTELMKSYVSMNFSDDVENRTDDIRELAEKVNLSFRDTKNYLIGIKRIHDHLLGKAPEFKNSPLILFDTWIESGMEASLDLEKTLNNQDMLSLVRGTEPKNTIRARIAHQIYRKIRDHHLFWLRGSFPKRLPRRSGDTPPQLLQYPHWTLVKELHGDEAPNKLPDDAKILVDRLNSADIKAVMKLVPSCRLRDYAISDPNFGALLEDYESILAREDLTPFLSSYIVEEMGKDEIDSDINSRKSRFTKEWDEFSPLKGMTNTSKAKEIDLDGDGITKLVYVKAVVGEQGPAYKSLADVLNEGDRFVVPAYQRSYEWDRDNIETLFADLYGCDLDEETPPLFLGTVLLRDGPAGANRYEVLDGQQRLLTVTLLCIWACQLLRTNGLHTFADLIVKGYLGNFNDVTENVRPKICPDPRDQDSLKKLLKTTTSMPWDFDGWGTTPKLEARTELESQFGNIDSVFGAELHSGGYLSDCRGLFELLLRVLHLSHVCQFVLSNTDDPFDTFQRLNHRGKKLQNADLIRSGVLQKCQPGQMQEFYDESWVKLEGLVGESGEGDAKEYKKSRLDKFFTCFAKAKNPGIKKNQSVVSLTKYWEKDSPNKIYQELVEFCSIYRMLYDFQTIHANEAVKRFGPEFATSIFLLSMISPPDDFGPFVINMLEKVDSDAALKSPVKDCIDLLSSWIVRHHISATGSTTLFGLQSVFTTDVWGKLEESSFDSDILFNAMDRKEFGPGELTDNNFKASLQTKDIYSSKIARALVFGLDTCSTGPGLILQANDTRLPNLAKFQIDHVAPQSWKNAEHWKDMEGLQPFIHTIGNLVAVEDRLNNEAQNEPFEQRAVRFSNQSTFKIARDLRTLPARPEWKEEFNAIWGREAIQFRNEQAAEALVKVFRFPFSKAKHPAPTN
ncbi:DUF262 domain-containing protein [Pseudomonadota bacterium]